MGVCEIATVANLSAGIACGILQKVETWLQCRQQVAMDLSRGNLQLRFQARVPMGIPATPALKSNQQNSQGNSDRRNNDDG
jgi:hypothetical protein